MEIKCDLCGKNAVQIGKGIFYCSDCDRIIALNEKDKEKLSELF